MQTYYNTIYLDSGYYIKKEEVFECGNGIFLKEKHYSPDGKCVYVKEIDSRGVYEEWRNYWDNGEIRGLYNSIGFKQEFDYRGLPIKE